MDAKATTEGVPFYRHNLGEEEKRRVCEALEQPILTTGRYVAEAEAAIAKYLGIEHAVCLDSCTAALHLALIASDIGPGDEVIVPAMTFAATANAVLMAGATPVFTDVDPETGNLTVETAAAKVTRRTRAIMPVHLYGLLCDMEAFDAFARRRGLLLIEDSAHCLEARHGAVRPGSHSRCACLSFYATKNITCGEGGALITRDGDLAERARRLALHGMTTSAYDRYGQAYKHWDIPQWGWKYNLDNIRGALLTPQVAQLDERWRRRMEIARRYEAAFSEMEGVEFPKVDHAERSARHLFTIWVEPERRDEILAHLQAQKIGVAVNYRAVHLLEYYAKTFGYRRGNLPAAERIGDRTISLPFYASLTQEQIERVIEGVQTAVESRQPSSSCAG